jgi:hypothetical protein
LVSQRQRKSAVWSHSIEIYEEETVKRDR